MSNRDKRNERAFSQAGTRVLAGFGPVPPAAGASLKRGPGKSNARRLPWLFTIDQAAHFECN